MVFNITRLKNTHVLYLIEKWVMIQWNVLQIQKMFNNVLFVFAVIFNYLVKTNHSLWLGTFCSFGEQKENISLIDGYVKEREKRKQQVTFSCSPLQWSTYRFKRALAVTYYARKNRRGLFWLLSHSLAECLLIVISVTDLFTSKVGSPLSRKALGKQRKARRNALYVLIYVYICAWRVCHLLKLRSFFFGLFVQGRSTVCYPWNCARKRKYNLLNG